MATGITTETTSAASGDALQGRDFRLLWTGETVSKTGSAVTTFALPLVALRTLHASTLTMGVLNATIWLPWLLVGLQAGAWADRRSQRTLMIGCQLASAALIVSIPVLAGLDALTLWYVLVIAFAAGCSNVLFTAAYNAFVPLLVGKGELLGANTRLMGSEQAANIAGPGIGGLITQLSSAVIGLFLDAASFVVGAFCVWRIRPRESDHGQARPEGGIRADIRAATRFVMGDPYLRIMTASSASANLMLAGIQALVVVFLIREDGLSPWAVSATTIVISIGGLTGAFAAPRIGRRLGSARTLLVATPVADCFLLLFPLAGHGAWLVPALGGTLIWATGVVVKNVTVGSFRQAYCPPGMRGRVAMTTRFISFGVWPVGSLLGGVLGSIFDVRTAVFVLAAANLLSNGWLFLGPLKRRRELPDEPVTTVP